MNEYLFDYGASTGRSFFFTRFEICLLAVVSRMFLRGKGNVTLKTDSGKEFCLVEQERYANQGYNSQALRQAADIVGIEDSDKVNSLTKNEEDPDGALRATHVQVMDNYR